jgi:TolA-binding protein
LYEGKGEFDAAARSYMRVAILFLHEELSPEALWRAAQCFEKANSREQARKSYEELVKDYPNSEQAAKAKQALAQLG